MPKPRTLQQSQMLSEIAEDSGLPVATIKKALESYETVAKNGVMNGKKVPLPGGMGYIYLSLTKSQSQKVHLELSNTDVIISPKLRSIVTFSKPWKMFINADSRAVPLIRKLLKEKLEKE